MPDGDSAPEGNYSERLQRKEENASEKSHPGTPLPPDPELLAAIEAHKKAMSTGRAISSDALRFGTVPSAAETAIKPISPELNVLVIELLLVEEEITKLQAEMKEDSSPEKRTRLIDLIGKGDVLVKEIKKQEEREKTTNK